MFSTPVSVRLTHASAKLVFVCRGKRRLACKWSYLKEFGALGNTNRSVKETVAAGKPSNPNKKGNDPRKHHYVPVFYQRNFANSEELLWVYDRLRQTYKELHPMSICFERDLYASKPEDKPRNTIVESKVLGVVDSAGYRGIRDFQIGRPNRSAEQEVAIFMAFQWTRVPSFSRDIRITYAKAIEEFTRIAFANVKRAEALIKSSGLDTEEYSNVTPESLVEAVQGKHITITATETAFLSTMMEQAVSLTKVLLDLDWEVLIASQDTGFLICDCPVVVVPPKGCAKVGFLVPGSAKYFPLSRHLCLRLGEAGTRRRLRPIGKEAVRVVNQNIAANSERFIMGPSRRQLENIVSRSGCAQMETTPRFVLETVKSSEDHALQMLSTQPRRYFYTRGDEYAP